MYLYLVECGNRVDYIFANTEKEAITMINSVYYCFNPSTTIARRL